MRKRKGKRKRMRKGKRGKARRKRKRKRKRGRERERGRTERQEEGRGEKRGSSHTTVLGMWIVRYYSPRVSRRTSMALLSYCSRTRALARNQSQVRR